MTKFEVKRFIIFENTKIVEAKSKEGAKQKFDEAFWDAGCEDDGYIEWEIKKVEGIMTLIGADI